MAAAWEAAEATDSQAMAVGAGVCWGSGWSGCGRTDSCGAGSAGAEGFGRSASCRAGSAGTEEPPCTGGMEGSEGAPAAAASEAKVEGAAGTAGASASTSGSDAVERGAAGSTGEEAEAPEAAGAAELTAPKIGESRTSGLCEEVGSGLLGRGWTTP